MKKIILFSLFLIIGLIGSQIIPSCVNPEAFETLKFLFDGMLYICLAYIMINVGREFELDKTQWKSYTADYFIAMATAAVPWLLICGYFIFLLPAEYRTSWDSWKETLLLSRFAAPTSAGILFTMLAAAGLKKSWVFQKTRVLAIYGKRFSSDRFYARFFLRPWKGILARSFPPYQAVVSAPLLLRR